MVDVVSAINADSEPAVALALDAEALHAELDRQIAVAREAAEKSEVS